MDWSSACAAVVPCLNEARAIAGVVRGIRAHLSVVWVVDDGSTDATSQMAADAGAKILSHRHPLGKGAALRTGLQAAEKAGFVWALLMDGDGQHAPEDIPAFFYAAEHGADLIIGNRMGECGRMPRARRLANRLSSRWISARLGFAAPDSQCGFRLIRLAAWQQANLQAQGFEIETEMLLAFARQHRRITFVPVRTLYGTEQSKFHPLAHTWRWWRWWRQQSVATVNPPSATAPQAGVTSTQVMNRTTP